jgi:hypothetical protein
LNLSHPARLGGKRCGEGEQERANVVMMRDKRRGKELRRVN